jgi:hypothetical protein
MPASPDEESGLDRVVAAVSALAGDAFSDRTGDEDPSQDNAPTHHNPL